MLGTLLKYLISFSWTINGELLLQNKAKYYITYYVKSELQSKLFSEENSLTIFCDTLYIREVANCGLIFLFIC